MIIKGLGLFQKKKKALEQNPEQIKEILNNGAKQARKLAQKNLEKVKEKIGLNSI